MIIHWIRTTTLVLAGVLASFAVSSASMPWIANTLERVRNNPLAYESYLRIDFTLAGALMLFVGLCGILRWGKRIHLWIWSVFLLSWIGATIVFLGDSGHVLMEEYSWIRYTTSGFLLLSSGAAAFFAWITLKRAHESRVLGLFWGAAALALTYASLDELLQFHEYFTSILETRFGLPHASGDLITVGYAAIILLVILFNARTFFRAYVSRHSARAMTFLIVGGVIYAISTLLDTFDMVLFSKIQSVANVLAQQPGFAISDFWYPLWAPKLFFNGVEEVFEHTAATFFFIGISLFVVERLRGEMSEKSLRKCGSLPIGGIIAATASALALIVASMPALAIQRPTIENHALELRAGYFDGLFHADDLFFHPSWGLLVADEGGSAVYRWTAGRWLRIPDPKRLLRDIDSVTATDDALYIADGAQKTIFQYTKKDGLTALWTKKDGLIHPEALVAVDPALYLVDNEKTMVRLEKGAPPVSWTPDHPDWIAPEGLAYNSEKKTFIVTDDKSGAVLDVSFQKSVKLRARLSVAEDVDMTRDGTVIVTDNGWGRIVALKKDGTQKILATFHRSYRDLQGVAMDDTGSLFVITADGHDSMSFMPSLLFEFKNSAL